MERSKEEKIRTEIFVWFKILSAGEMTQLRKFLHSPFFNTTEEIGIIYDKLVTQFKRNPEPGKWNAQKTADDLYSEEKAEGRRLHKLYEHLLRLKQLIAQFISHYALKYDDAKRLPMLIDELSRRPDKELFDQACDEYENILDSSILDADNYGNLAWLYRERHHYQTAERFAPNLPNLIATNDYLDRHYLVLKLRHITESFIAENIFKEKSKLEPIISPVLELAAYYYSKDILIRVYVDIVTFLKEGYKEQKFLDFQTVFFGSYSKLPQKDKQSIIKTVIHLYYNWLLTDVANLTDYIIRWLKLATNEGEVFSKELFLLNREIDDGIFLNLICTAAIGKDFDLANKLIEVFLPSVNISKRENARIIALSYLYLHQEKYDEAHKLLKANDIELEPSSDSNEKNKRRSDYKYDELVLQEFKYAIRARTVMIRLYLMQYILHWKYSYNFLLALGSFRKYLEPTNRPSHFDEARTKAYQNFLTALSDIYSYRNKRKNSKKENSELYQRIASYQPIVCRDWLLDAINKVND